MAANLKRVAPPPQLTKVATAEFRRVKETKGTFVFAELDEDGEVATEGYVIGQLYVRKTALKGEAPERLIVTVESVA
jgi:hypothetical protein